MIGGSGKRNDCVRSFPTAPVSNKCVNNPGWPFWSAFHFSTEIGDWSVEGIILCLVYFGFASFFFRSFSSLWTL